MSKYIPLSITLSSVSNPDARTLTPSIARQQTYPILGRDRLSFAQDRTHCGPVNKKLIMCKVSKQAT